MLEIDSKGLEIYYQECEDLFDEIEGSILALETNPKDFDSINTAFRGFHTVKGGSAMFGLTELTDYTHHVESLLASLREGQISISSALISALLDSIDCLKMFIMFYQEKATMDSERISRNLQEIKSLGSSVLPDSSAGTNLPTPEISAKSDAFSTVEDQSKIIEKAGVNHFLITARFQKNLLKEGGDPISFIKDIKDLGKTIIIPHSHHVPALDLIDPGILYLQWTIKLETEKSLENVDEILMFFTEDHDISIEDIGKPPVETTEKAIINQETYPEELPEALPLPATEIQNSTVKPKPASVSSRGSDSIRVATVKLDKLVNLVGEAVINQSRFTKIFDKVAALDDQLGESLLQLLDDNDLIVREVQDQVLNIRMVPIQGVFSPLHRMVRDYTVESGKNIRLEITGGDTELDKTLTEKLSGPIKHLIRNAMDHGIEMPQVRSQAGKDATGLIAIHAFQEEGHLAIEIKDDGNGISTEKILENAHRKGLVKTGEEPSEQEIYQLLFSPGFSTAETVTDVSGRGVGMDVVKRDIESLHGHVAIESEPGKGTLFRIKLPLTLAIIEGMLIKVGPEIFTIPLLSIVESLRPQHEQVKTIKKRGEVVKVRDEYIPLIRLHELFNLIPKTENPAEALVIIVENLGQKYGILVDSIEEQQQIVIKSLEDNFVQLPGIAGATILGDGNISLILEIAGLIKYCHEKQQKLVSV